MDDYGWTPAKIAELRRLAVRLWEAETAVAVEGMGMSTGGWSAPLDDAISDEERAKAEVLPMLKGGALLFLLDELERVRSEREAMRNEIIVLRAELDEYHAEEVGPYPTSDILEPSLDEISIRMWTDETL